MKYIEHIFLYRLVTSPCYLSNSTYQNWSVVSMVNFSGKLVRLFIKLFIYFWLIAQIELSLTFEKVCARFSIFAMHTLPPTPWCDYPSVRVYILLKRLIYSSLPFSRALFLTQIILIIAIPHWSRRENLIWLKYLNFASFFGPKCVQFRLL